MSKISSTSGIVINFYQERPQNINESSLYFVLKKFTPDKGAYQKQNKVILKVQVSTNPAWLINEPA